MWHLQLFDKVFHHNEIEKHGDGGNEDFGGDAGELLYQGDMHIVQQQSVDKAQELGHQRNENQLIQKVYGILPFQGNSAVVPENLPGGEEKDEGDTHPGAEKVVRYHIGRYISQDGKYTKIQKPANAAEAHKPDGLHQ